MLRRMLAAAVAVAVGAAFLSSAFAAEIKDIKGCMAFQGKVRKDVPELLKSKDPNWEDVQKQTKDWVAMAETLGKQKPPMGTETSWKEQTTKYLATVKDIDAAAGKKDVDGMKKGLGMVGTACGGCHKNHKPPK